MAQNFRFWIYIVFSALTLAALAAGFVLSLLIDWNAHRRWIETGMTRLTGLAVAIEGDIDIRFLPTPALRLRDLDIQIPDIRAGDGDETPPRLQIAGIAFRFEPAALFGGRFAIHDMVVRGARLRLGDDPIPHLSAFLPRAGAAPAQEQASSPSQDDRHDAFGEGPAPSTSGPLGFVQRRVLASLRRDIAELRHGRLVDASLSVAGAADPNLFIDADFSFDLEDRRFDIKGEAEWNDRRRRFRLRRLRHPATPSLFTIDANLRDDRGRTIADMRFAPPDFDADAATAEDRPTSATAQRILADPKAVHGVIRASLSDLLGVAGDDSPLDAAYLEADLAWALDDAIAFPEIEILAPGIKIDGRADLIFAPDAASSPRLDGDFRLNVSDIANVAARAADAPSCRERLTNGLSALTELSAAAAPPIVELINGMSGRLSLDAPLLPIGATLISDLAAGLELDDQGGMILAAQATTPWEGALALKDVVLFAPPDKTDANADANAVRGAFSAELRRSGRLLKAICPEFADRAFGFDDETFAAQGEIDIGREFRLDKLKLKLADAVGEGRFSFADESGIAMRLDIDRLNMDRLLAPSRRTQDDRRPLSRPSPPPIPIALDLDVDRLDTAAAALRKVAFDAEWHGSAWRKAALEIGDLAGLTLKAELTASPDDDRIAVALTASSDEPSRLVALIAENRDIEASRLLDALARTEALKASLNWIGTTPGAGVAENRFSGEFAFDDVNVTVEGESAGDLTADFDSLRALPLKADIAARIPDRKLPFIDGDDAPAIPLNLTATLDGGGDRPLTVAIEADSPDLNLAFNGAIDELSENAAFRGGVKLTSPGLAAHPHAPLPSWLGDEALNAVAVLEGKFDDLTFKAMQGTIGGRSFSGSGRLAVGSPSAARTSPLLDLSLDLRAERLVPTATLLGIFDLSGERPNLCPAPADARVDWRMWPDYRLDIDLEADALALPFLSPLQSVAARLRLDDGDLALTLNAADSSDGAAHLQALLRGGVRIPEIDLVYALDAIDIAPFFADAAPLGGRLESRGNLSAVGAGPRAMIASLHGGGNLRLADAAMLGADLPAFVDDLSKAIDIETLPDDANRRLLSGRTPLGALVSGFTVAGGIVQSRGGDIEGETMDGAVIMIADIPLCTLDLDARLRVDEDNWPTIRATHRRRNPNENENDGEAAHNDIIWNFDVWGATFARTVQLLEATTTPEDAYQFSQNLLELLRRRLEENDAEGVSTRSQYIR